ncbi:MAG: pseudoazurin [Cocleimonas sp.]|nr:pseudoazurin [Cocleimonas sp.]
MKPIKFLAIALMSIIQFSPVYAADHEVKMLNNGTDGIMVFEPSSLKVAVGDTVTFVPTDASHNASSYFVPKDATTWVGEIGKEVSVTLNKEGIYIYKCDPHSVLGMVGVIQVGEAKNKEEAKKSASELAKTFSLNKDRLDHYITALSEDKKESKVEEKKKEEK